MSGKCRLNSTMPESSPPSSQARRIASAVGSSTVNMALQLGLGRGSEQACRASPPGLSHLAEDGSGELVAPSGALSFATDGDVGPGGAENVEGEPSQDGQVLRPM